MTVFAANLIEKGIEKERAEAIERMLKKKYSKEDILELGYTESEYQEVEKRLLATITV